MMAELHSKIEEDPPESAVTIPSSGSRNTCSSSGSSWDDLERFVERLKSRLREDEVEDLGL